MATRLDGRRVLVTGASSGIGRAVAAAVAEEGARLALLARREEPLRRIAAELPGDHLVVPLDVTDLESVGPAVDGAAAALGGIDAVVNSAGIAIPGRVRDTAPNAWRRMFDVNVVGLLAVTHAAIGHLAEAEPADVVNVSSMSGRRRGSVEMGVYAATKHAVHVVSDSLRDELLDSGIRVSLVSPGYVRTPIFHEVEDRRLRERFREAVDAQGLAPERVADQVVHVLAQPVGVVVPEIALVSTRQRY